MDLQELDSGSSDLDFGMQNLTFADVRYTDFLFSCGTKPFQND